MFEEGNIIYKIIVASFVMPVLLSGGLLWFFVTYNKKKNEYLLSLKDEELKRQQLIIEKQTALEAERTRIAAEMHDDLGGGLTSIKYLSQKALRKIEDEKVQSQMQKIVDKAQTLVNNMSEIIWTMNAGFDTLDNLIAYSRRYAFEFLEDYDIDLSFKVDGLTEDINLSGEQRRNIFLVVKEALNNTVKHAEAKNIAVVFTVAEDINILIKDDGVGLTNDISKLGNGLTNMKNRIENLDGSLEYKNENGLGLNINLPKAKVTPPPN